MLDKIKQFLCKHQFETKWITNKYFGIPYIEIDTCVKKCKKCGKVIPFD